MRPGFWNIHVNRLPNLNRCTKARFYFRDVKIKTKILICIKSCHHAAKISIEISNVKKNADYFLQMIVIASSTVTICCSPVVMSFRVIFPSAISDSPTMATNGIDSESARPICFFIFEASG